jgi:hypothetical protein
MDVSINDPHEQRNSRKKAQRAQKRAEKKISRKGAWVRENEPQVNMAGDSCFFAIFVPFCGYSVCRAMPQQTAFFLAPATSTTLLR